MRITATHLNPPLRTTCTIAGNPIEPHGCRPRLAARVDPDPAFVKNPGIRPRLRATDCEVTACRGNRTPPKPTAGNDGASTILLEMPRIRQRHGVGVRRRIEQIQTSSRSTLEQINRNGIAKRVQSNVTSPNTVPGIQPSHSPHSCITVALKKPSGRKVERSCSSSRTWSVASGTR